MLIKQRYYSISNANNSLRTYTQSTSTVKCLACQVHKLHEILSKDKNLTLIGINLCDDADDAIALVVEEF